MSVKALFIYYKSNYVFSNLKIYVFIINLLSTHVYVTILLRV